MANKYANLVGTNKIKEEYSKINTGFDKVEADINNANSRITAVNNRVDKIITTPIDGEAAAQEIVDARGNFSTIGGRMTKIEGDIETHKADNAAHRGIIYRKNLLHNWDFRNPVNQRGFTHTSNAGYTIDRWRLATSGHTVEVVSNGIKLIASKNASLDMCFVQFVENYSMFVGVPLTLSVNIVENTLTQGCNLRWNANASPAIMGTGYFSTTFTPSSLPYLQIGVQFANRNIDDGKYIIIDRMKLEFGSVSTLANDPPADFGEQLALCQRYALVLGAGSYSFRASKYDANAISFIIPTPVTMRIHPTFVGTLTVMSAGVEQTGFTFSIYRNAGSLAIVASKPAHGLTDAWLDVLNNTLFSADL